MTEKEELERYRAIAAKFGEPKYKGKYLRLYKEAFPEANVPEVDMQDELDAKLKKELEARDEEIKKLKEDQFKKRFEDDYERKRQRLAGAPWYFNDEQVKQAEELVEKKGFPEVELAADYIRATTQPLKPSGLGILGFTPTQTSKDRRKEFNERYSGVFKKTPSKFKETMKEAFDKIESGEYINEM